MSVYCERKSCRFHVECIFYGGVCSGIGEYKAIKIDKNGKCQSFEKKIKPNTPTEGG